MQLPVAFENRMRDMLKEEYEVFISAFNEPHKRRHDT